MATVVCKSPLAALSLSLSLSASPERWRTSDNAIPDIVPFIPSRNRSLTLRGSYTPSSSTMAQPTKAQNSSKVCQSRPLRARRDASMETTAPT